MCLSQIFCWNISQVTQGVKGRISAENCLQKPTFALSRLAFRNTEKVPLLLGNRRAAGAGMRIPTKSDTCFNSNRTLIPIDVAQLSERSDGLVLVIKKCPV